MSFFADHTACGCCGYHASEDILTKMSFAALERAALDYVGLKRVLKEESGDAPYVDGEVRLTELLADNAMEQADQIEEPLFEAIGDEYLDEVRITTAMMIGGAAWQAASWPDKLENEVRETLSAIALIGQHDIPFGPALSDIQRLRIVNGMSLSAKYYTNRYFNEHVMTAVVDAVHVAVLNGLANDQNQIRAIHTLLDRRLRSVPYWNIVANGAASRAYHYGYIKTGEAHGFTTIGFQATMDSKTSQICRDMNGKQWHIRQLSDLADRIADANGDEIKTVAPWMKPADIEGMDETQLALAGVAIPPLHGRCRSRLVFIG